MFRVSMLARARACHPRNKLSETTSSSVHILGLIPPLCSLRSNVSQLSGAQPALKFDCYRERIDTALDRYTQFDADCPAQLREAIRYALLAPGKRLRPRLVLMAAEACGGDVDTALPAACAVEMVHA